MPWFQFHLEDVAFSFLSVLLEAVPFLLLGSIVSGIVEAFVPSRVLNRLIPGHRAAAVWVGGLLGALLPICECGSVIVVRRLIRRGLPVSCGIAYMLAAPVVNPVVALSTWAAFRGQDAVWMTVLRVGLSYLLAVGVALLAGRIRPATLLAPGILATMPAARRAGLGRLAQAPGNNAVADRGMPRLDRCLMAARAGVADFLDVTFYLVIGVAITAVFGTAVDQTLLEPLASNPFYATPAMMALASALAICSTSDAFVAASFIQFPWASKLAFLTFGPMFDLKLVFLYRILFRGRWIAALGIGLFVAVGLICLRIEGLMAAATGGNP